MSQDATGETASRGAVTHRDLAVLRTQIMEIIKAQGDRIDGLLIEHDLRYEQRFRAQVEALNAALAAQEKSAAAALAATKEASAATQDAADRAVLKAENSNNERFANLAQKLDELTRKIDVSIGMGGGLRQGWAYLLGGVVLLSTIVNLYMLASK
jgi:hypothetical protein